MKTILLIGCLVLLATGFVYSQDKIYRKNGRVLDVEIIEIDPGLIKYREPRKGTSIIFSLEKDKVSKVVFANGETERYLDQLRDPELYADQLQRAVKFNFLSPLFGFTQFTYERLLRPGRSYEVALGVIGLGKNTEIMEWNDQEFRRDAKGAFFEGGMKFIKLPNFRNSTTRYTNIMQGSYLRPDLIVGYYSNNVVVDKNGEYQTQKQNVTFGGLMLDLGRQWVFGDKILLDIYVGVGYALDNIKENDRDVWVDYALNHFALLTGGNTGIGIRSGLKVGLLIK